MCEAGGGGTVAVAVNISVRNRGETKGAATAVKLSMCCQHFESNMASLHILSAAAAGGAVAGGGAAGRPRAGLIWEGQLPASAVQQCKQQQAMCGAGRPANSQLCHFGSYSHACCVSDSCLKE